VEVAAGRGGGDRARRRPHGAKAIFCAPPGRRLEPTRLLEEVQELGHPSRPRGCRLSRPSTYVCVADDQGGCPSEGLTGADGPRLDQGHHGRVRASAMKAFEQMLEAANGHDELVQTAPEDPVAPSSPHRVDSPESHDEGGNPQIRLNGAAQESNLPSVGLPRLTGFEDRLGHRARAAPAGA
jgi:hypothetical protein